MSALVFDFVKRGCHFRRGKILAQILHILPKQHVAVMRVMQDTLNPVQNDANSRPLERFHLGAQVVQQRFDFAPVDVAADRVLKNAVYQMLVFMAHGEIDLFTHWQQNT